MPNLLICLQPLSVISKLNKKKLPETLYFTCNEKRSKKRYSEYTKNSLDMIKSKNVKRSF